MICLAVSACSATNVPGTAHIDVHQLYTKCGRPSPPVFERIPLDAHIGSQVAQDKLTRNLVEWELYSNATHGALECYDTQSAPKE